MSSNDQVKRLEALLAEFSTSDLDSGSDIEPPSSPSGKVKSLIDEDLDFDDSSVSIKSTKHSKDEALDIKPPNSSQESLVSVSKESVVAKPPSSDFPPPLPPKVRSNYVSKPSKPEVSSKSSSNVLDKFDMLIQESELILEDDLDEEDSKIPPQVRKETIKPKNKEHAVSDVRDVQSETMLEVKKDTPRDASLEITNNAKELKSTKPQVEASEPIKSVAEPSVQNNLSKASSTEPDNKAQGKKGSKNTTKESISSPPADVALVSDNMTTAVKPEGEVKSKNVQQKESPVKTDVNTKTKNAKAGKKKNKAKSEPVTKVSNASKGSEQTKKTETSSPTEKSSAKDVYKKSPAPAAKTPTLDIKPLVLKGEPLKCGPVPVETFVTVTKRASSYKNFLKSVQPKPVSTSAGLKRIRGEPLKCGPARVESPLNVARKSTTSTLRSANAAYKVSSSKLKAEPLKCGPARVESPLNMPAKPLTSSKRVTNVTSKTKAEPLKSNSKTKAEPLKCGPSNVEGPLSEAAKAKTQIGASKILNTKSKAVESPSEPLLAKDNGKVTKPDTAVKSTPVSEVKPVVEQPKEQVKEIKEQPKQVKEQPKQVKEQPKEEPKEAKASTTVPKTTAKEPESSKPTETKSVPSKSVDPPKPAPKETNQKVEATTTTKSAVKKAPGVPLTESDDPNNVYLFMSMASGVRGTMARYNRACTILDSYDIKYTPIEVTMDERAKRLWKYQGVAKNKSLPAVFRDRDLKCDYDELLEANEMEDLDEVIFDGL